MKRLYLNYGNYTIALIKRMYSGSKNKTLKTAKAVAFCTLPGRYIILIIVIISFFSFFTQTIASAVCVKTGQANLTSTLPGMIQTENDFVKIKHNNSEIRQVNMDDS